MTAIRWALRIVGWPFRSLLRINVIGWLVGFLVVGSATSSSADPSPIPIPDLAGGGAQTVFERAPWAGYDLPSHIDAAHDGFPQGALWQVIKFLNFLVMSIGSLLVRGALAAVQFMTGLDLLRDNGSKVDDASVAVAAQVFYPLIGTTVAIAFFTVWSKSRRDGGGFFGEALKAVVIAVMAFAFVAAPSSLLQPLDDVRVSASNAAMKGYSAVGGSDTTSAAGYPPVAIVDDGNRPIRLLTDSLWDTYVTQPWCWAAFGDLDLCKKLGHEFLDNSSTWQAIDAEMAVEDTNTAPPAVGGSENSADSVGGPNADQQAAAAQRCPAAIPTASCDWVRGQDFHRVTAVMIFMIVTIPLAILILSLVVFGLIALIGVVFYALMGAVALVGAVIPGLGRRVAGKWAEALLGSLLQSVVITTILGVMLVFSGILSKMIPTYGFLAFGVLNIAMFVVALRTRHHFENWSNLTHAGTASLGSTYLAVKALGGLGRMTRGAVGGARRTVDRATSGISLGKAAPPVTGLFKGPKATPLQSHPASTTGAAAGAGASTGGAGWWSAGGQLTERRPVSTMWSQHSVTGRSQQALPSATPQRQALPAAGTLTAEPDGSRFVAGGGTGPVDGARRRIVQPSRRNIHTPPVGPPKSSEIHWGARRDPTVITQPPVALRSHPVNPHAAVERWQTPNERRRPSMTVLPSRPAVSYQVRPKPLPVPRPDLLPPLHYAKPPRPKEPSR